MTAFEQLQEKAIKHGKEIAIKMAKLELLHVHDNPGREQELKTYFGFNDKSLAKRKKELQEIVNA